MKRSWKLFFMSLILVFIIAIGWFFSTHWTYYKYNDKWIIGRHYKEVEKRYGKFDVEFGMRGYLIDKGDPHAVMPKRGPKYYWIVSDENGIVTNVFVSGPPGG